MERRKRRRRQRRRRIERILKILVVQCVFSIAFVSIRASNNTVGLDWIVCLLCYKPSMQALALCHCLAKSTTARTAYIALTQSIHFFALGFLTLSLAILYYACVVACIHATSKLQENAEQKSTGKNWFPY